MAGIGPAWLEGKVLLDQTGEGRAASGEQGWEPSPENKQTEGSVDISALGSDTVSQLVEKWRPSRLTRGQCTLSRVFDLFELEWKARP